MLNFASAANPGGGVTQGSTAQEEALCRCSSLYQNLKQKDLWDRFYLPHRQMQDPRYNDDIIYLPNVVVLKTDTAFLERMQEEAWFSVNVITCATPNLRTRTGEEPVKISRKELYDLHEKRLRRILDVACLEKNEVLLLGAFGCGAFRNPPEIVAGVMRKLVCEEYRHAFQVVEAAVYCPPGKDENYQVVQREFKIKC